MDVEHFHSSSGRSSTYSAAVRTEGLIVTSGQVGAQPGGPAVPFAEQARTALEETLKTIELAGGTRAGILSIRAYLASLDDYAEWNAAYREIMGSGDDMPARTTVQAGLVPPLLVEIEAMASVTAAGA